MRVISSLSVLQCVLLCVLQRVLQCVLQCVTVSYGVLQDPTHSFGALPLYIYTLALTHTHTHAQEGVTAPQ